MDMRETALNPKRESTDGDYAGKFIANGEEENGRARVYGKEIQRKHGSGKGAIQPARVKCVVLSVGTPMASLKNTCYT